MGDVKNSVVEEMGEGNGDDTAEVGNEDNSIRENVTLAKRL